MLYTEWKIGEKEPLKLRLRARDCVQLEKALGTNPLNVLMRMEQHDEIPELSSVMSILHASLQCYQHGIKLDDVFDYCDEYVESGGSQVELLEIITKIFDVSGFLPKDKEESEETEKNGVGAK